jgi:non-heme chloroperoxidase
MGAQLITLDSGLTLNVTDEGQGRPIVLIHGVCMSQSFFVRNIGPLASTNRVIALDLRGHGESPAIEGGHTIAQYARDLRELIEQLELDGAVLVGWSMGSLVGWEYQVQFADDTRLAGMVVISQGPSDLTQPGWPFGIGNVDDLHGFVAEMQTDFRGFFEGFVPSMFMDDLDPAQEQAFLDETAKVGANAGSLILLDQTLRDYREQVASFELPHLLLWGRDEGVIQVGSGEWLLERLPSAEMHVFEESGHCPMWEEPEDFNQRVASWVAAL